MSSGEAEKTEITWWQGLIVGFFLLAGSVAHIFLQGGIHDPLTVGALFSGLFATYVIYDAIEDYRSQSAENREVGHLPSKLGTKDKLRSAMEKWETEDRSVSAIIYTWFTLGFTLIFLFPPSEWWGPVRLLVLTLAGGVIWARTGGAGPAETSKVKMKRFGAGVAGVLSGLVIALSVRWLFAKVL